MHGGRTLKPCQDMLFISAVKAAFRAVLRQLPYYVAQLFCYILLSMALHYAIMRNHTRILHHWADIFIIDIVSIR